MSNTTKEIYQENQIITKSINKIIEEASTDREILAKLRNLKAATQTQLTIYLQVIILRFRFINSYCISNIIIYYAIL